MEPGFGFGIGAALGAAGGALAGAAAARVTGLGFGGAAGAARCGKRSGGGGNSPLRSGSAGITFGTPDGLLDLDEGATSSSLS